VISGPDNNSEVLERQLQRELRDKEEELERLRAMARDRQVAMEARETFGLKVERGADYQRLSSEVD
jgi:CMP-2-keto-3-deoxyoctulosonic acid synthetase